MHAISSYHGNRHTHTPTHTQTDRTDYNTQCRSFAMLNGMIWYGIVEFNVPLDTVYVISETTILSSDVHLPFSNGGPAT